MSITKVYKAMRDQGRLQADWPMILFAFCAYLLMGAGLLYGGLHEPDGAKALLILMLLPFFIYISASTYIDSIMRRQREDELWATYYKGRADLIASMDADPTITAEHRAFLLKTHDMIDKPFYT